MVGVVGNAVNETTMAELAADVQASTIVRSV